MQELPVIPIGFFPESGLSNTFSLLRSEPNLYVAPMNWAQECVAIMPCHNGSAQIGKVIAEVRKILPNVIVVDDGSTDATADAAAKAGAQVFRHDKNRGKGAALITGFSEARKQGFLWALMMDADGQHSPQDIPVFFAAAEKSHAPFIIGDRMANPKSMPLLRRWTNATMSWLLSNYTRRVLPDTQCGFRLVKLNSFSENALETSRFEIDSEMLVLFSHNAQSIESVPVRVIYGEERSNIDVFRDTIRWLKWFRSLPRETPPAYRLILNAIRSIAQIIIVGVIVGWILNHTARPGSTREPAGFFLGMLHGALTPCALPNLAAGYDVEIYAPQNVGRLYKFGYAAGINVCGLIFFAFLYSQVRHWKKKPVQKNKPQ
jgi:glycosyltransferase involved in cell wall biosynthesis